MFAAILLCGGMAVSAAAPADDGAAPLWMRYPKISPDGTMIAFSYRGDIYYVPVSGGNDSRTIAFVSDRFGGMDIFTVGTGGGNAVRITTHSGTETPLAFSPDDKYIYFSAAIQDPASSAMWSSLSGEVRRRASGTGDSYSCMLRKLRT